MKKFLIVLLTILLLLTSCEIITKQNKSQRNVYLISLALNYSTTSYGLNCTINDQSAIFDEIKYLSNSTSSPFSYYLLTEDGNNLRINENGKIENETIDFTKPSNRIKDLLLSKLSNFSSIIDENDLLIFHYSGHGDNDGSLVYHLRTSPFKKYIISTEEISNSIKGNKGIKLLVLDSCYSGAFYDEISSEYNKNSINYLFEAPQSRRNIFALTAASSTEEAWEEDGFGRLSKCFLEALGYNTSTKTLGKKNKTLWYSEIVTQIQKNINVKHKSTLQHAQGNEIKDFILF